MTTPAPTFEPKSFTGIGKAKEYMQSPERQSFVLEWIAAGKPLTKLAEFVGLRYVDLYRVLTTDNRADYMAARAAHSERLTEANLHMADEVEALNLPSDAARTASGIRQWHMERAAPEEWGKKASLDVTHKGVVGLHLDAIRQLASTPLEGEYTEVLEEADPLPPANEDEDDEPQPQPPKEHPLL